jgi:NADH dehydrogenase [ubiquinone] 1 alpha subcomplex assembly factor 7
MQANPDRAERVARELSRLTDDNEMGALFKVICLSSPNLPAPAGF